MSSEAASAGRRRLAGKRLSDRYFGCKSSFCRLEHTRNLKEHGMSDARAEKPPAHNRVSIRAILVHEGEDATAALAEAGLVDVISIPVVLGEDSHLPEGILGDGITQNLTAVLETVQQEASDAFSSPPAATAGSDREATPEPRPATTTLPAAFGTRPLAPVWRSSFVGPIAGQAADLAWDHAASPVAVRSTANAQGRADDPG